MKAMKDRAASQPSQIDQIDRTDPTDRTDWERVDGMKDEEIDFSDLPEIPPEKLSRAVVRKGLQPVTPKLRPHRQPVEDELPTRVEDLIGCTGYRGPAKSLAEMDQGIADGTDSSARR